MLHQFTVLHISDLHERGPREKERARRYRVLGAAWQKNLEELQQEGPIDLVCFTGDLADWGQAEEYARVSTLLDALLKQLGIGRERLFLVPGNHDIDRKILADKTQKSPEQLAFGKLRESLQNATPLDVARWLEGGKPPFGFEQAWLDLTLSRQNAYRNFLQAFGLAKLLPSDALHPHLGYRVSLQLPTLPFPVQVVGLDSSWLAGDDADSGRLRLTDGQVMRLCLDAEGGALPGFRLALVHHPLSDLADASQCRALLAESVHLLLRGHMHESELTEWADSDRKLRSMAAGCLYEGDRADQHPNSCSVIRVQCDDAGLPLRYDVRLRSFSARSGHWFDDGGIYRNAPSGRLTIQLAAPPSSPLPPNGARSGRKPPTSKKAKPATLPPSAPTVPDPTAAVVPSQVLPPQPSTVTTQIAEPSANPAQASEEQRLRAKIAKALKDKDGSVLLVVGAGVSMGATLGSQHAKSASWDGLLELGIARCKSRWPNARDTTALQDALTERSATNLITAATVVERRLVAKKDWKRWLHEMFSKLVPTQPAVLEALCELGLPLVTANYDGLLEYVGRRQAVTWRDHAMVERLLRGELAGILHLHGHFAEPESVVFGADSYERVMDDGHTQAILRKLFLDKTLVFIGFGDGLHDPNFDELLHWASKSVLGSDVFHVRLALEKELPLLWMLHPAGQRLTAISYGKKHEDLAPFIRSLAQSNPSPGGSGGGQPGAAATVSMPTARPATVVVAGSVAAPTTAATDVAKPLPSAVSLPALDKLKKQVRKFLQDELALTKALAERGCGNPAQAGTELVEGVLNEMLQRSAQDVAGLLANLADSDDLRDSARDLLWHILPLAGGWEDVFDHAEKASASGGALELPLRTTTLAEIVMARSDARKVQFSLEHEEPQGVLHIPLPSTAYAPLFDADGSKLAHAVLFNLYQDQPPDGLLPDAKHWRGVKKSYPNTDEFNETVKSEINYAGSRQHRYLLFIDGLLKRDQNDLDLAWNITQKAIQKLLPGLRLVRLKGQLTENSRESNLRSHITEIRKLS